MATDNATTAEQDLAAARKAWKDKATAESQLARLRSYSRLSAGMKADQQEWAGALTVAVATLNRVLGGTR